MSVLEELKTAVEGRKSVKFTYDGRLRYCSPHSIGYKGPLEKVMMICYQYDGETSKGPVVYGSGIDRNWRCLDISKIDKIEEVIDVWHTSDSNGNRSRCIDTLLFQVHE